MKAIFDQVSNYTDFILDMIQPEDIYCCLFSLLMQRQAEIYGDVPSPQEAKHLAAEHTKMDQTYRSYEVAVLFELMEWLRQNQYHWWCSPEMKNSLMLYLLGITKTKPELQRPSIWTSEDPTFEIRVQEEAFDKLEELFEEHWFTQVCNQHYEIDRKHSNTSKYGCIIFIKEGDDNDV